MSHLYDNEQLWKHVCMVGFADHYVVGDNGEMATPFATFQRQKQAQPAEEPIFCGVVLNGWEHDDAAAVAQRVNAFKDAGIDYIRLECNLGTAHEIGDAAELVNNVRFVRLAEVAQMCQQQSIVPLVLLQMPWREPGDASSNYFKQAVHSFADALKRAKVDVRRVLFETRPPMTVSAQAEKGLKGTERTSLGFDIGSRMFEVLNEAFNDGDSIAGFCVAGGSTKGDLPLAMEDDTQNAVRQGMRQCARQQWGQGMQLCFWEMYRRRGSSPRFLSLVP